MLTTNRTTFTSNFKRPKRAHGLLGPVFFRTPRLAAVAASLAQAAAGAHVELNYTKGLNAGEFSDALGESIVRMFDQATRRK